MYRYTLGPGSVDKSEMDRFGPAPVDKGEVYGFGLGPVDKSELHGKKDPVYISSSPAWNTVCVKKEGRFQLGNGWS